MSRLELRVLRRAAGQIIAALWWQSNRQPARDALKEDLRAALELIRIDPLIGSRWLAARHRAVRRLYLGRVRYHLYYRLSPDGSAVEVLAFWHQNRSTDPPI